MSFPLIASLKEWASRLEREVVAVYFAARDPRTPVHIRVLAMAIAAYALSPIDLIPDFIPVLGYLDELLLLPLGIWLVMRLLPPEVLQQAQTKALEAVRRPRSRVAAFVIVTLWLVCAAAFFNWLWSASGT